MKSAVFGAPRNLYLEERPVPQPAAGEALIRVGAAGVCAGDLYIYNGTNPYVVYPRVGGHEVAGRWSASAGHHRAGARDARGRRAVHGLRHVLSVPDRQINCCANLRIIGAHRDGGFADYLTAPVDRLHAVPDGLSDFKASFAEPVAIGVQSCRRGMISGDDTILVLGAGPIGLAILEVARARGAKVFITDIDADRLATAAELGGTPLVAGDGLLDEVLRLTSGEGMPVVVEATGNAKAMESTVDLVAAGGRIVIVGLVKKGTMISFPGLDFTRKEMTVIGSRASVGCFPESLDLLNSGAIRYPDIATAFALSEAPQVFSRIADGGVPLHKAVFLGENS